MQSRNVRGGQGGFTLIELIAVIVILGILAAAAVPRYYDIQDEAKEASAYGGVAAAQSALSLGFAANLVGASGAPASPTAACSQVSTDGKAAFSVTCDGANWTASSVTITSTYDGVDVTGTWTNPNS